MLDMATRELTSFCTDFSPEDLTPDVIRAVKHRLLDFLGVALRGSTLPSSRIVIDVVKSMGGARESTVMGVGGKAPSPNAALANGSMGHGLELDDVHNESSLHPGAAVIPAALAVAEREGASGEALASSIVLGYEVMTRVGMAVTPMGHYARGFHPTGTCGAFGAAVAAGKILALSVDQMGSAMGIAGSQASGLMEYLSDGSWTKRLHPGWAAHSGVIAASLAQRGYSGPKTVLEGGKGFVRAYSDHYDLAKLTEGLGERWAVKNVSVKHYACCYYKQSAIDALLELVGKHGVKAEDVEEVVVSLVKVAMPIVAEPPEDKYDVKSVVDAQFSMPYGAAVALSRGNAFIDEYTEDTMRDPGIQGLMKKVRVVHDPGLDKDYPNLWPSKARIKTKDGRVYETRIDLPKGDPRNPFTDEELQGRFSILARGVLPAENINKAIETISKLEDLDDVNELTDWLG